MCGIVGLINKTSVGFDYEKKVFLNTCDSMLNKLRHRGPEFRKTEYVSKNLILGHTRLSIIDINDRANQPMYDSSRKYCITLNGEIYNYKELYGKLKHKYDFKTCSDTEVVINLFREFGQDSFNMLDGIFAFVICDIEKNEIYIVRDKVGKKPLYIYETEVNIFISSELKAYNEIDEFIPIIDHETLDYCLTCKHSPSLSPFANVKMIEAGNFIKIEYNNGHFNKTQEKYFELISLIDSNDYWRYKKKSKNEILDEFEYLLRNSIKKRFTADVPIVSINSGGLDSSLISLLSSELDKDIKLFHIDVENNSEKYYAQLLAKKMNVELISIKFNIEQFQKYFIEASKAYEYYMIHPNNVGMYILSKEINNLGYKVVLGGEAADEIFGGYKHLSGYFIKNKRANKIPGIIKKKLKQSINKCIKYLNENNIQGTNIDIFNQYNNSYKNIKENSLISSFNRSFKHILNEEERNYRSHLFYDYVRYLQPLFLRGDKLFMANSVELRLPFADIDLLHFALNIPTEYLYNKNIVRMLSHNKLPKEIINRKKVGFPVPYNIDFKQKQFLGIIDPNKLNRQNRISLYGMDVFIEKCFDNKFIL